MASTAGHLRINFYKSSENNAGGAGGAAAGSAADGAAGAAAAGHGLSGSLDLRGSLNLGSSLDLGNSIMLGDRDGLMLLSTSLVFLSSDGGGDEARNDGRSGSH